jgi:hypothetical protein
MTADIMWIHRVSFLTDSIDHRHNIIFFLMAIDLIKICLSPLIIGIDPINVFTRLCSQAAVL